MDNKDLVLNVLKGTNQNTQTPDFLKYFDSIYTYYSQHKKNNFKNLTEMNKAIIDECYSWINNKSSGKNEEKKKIKLETVDLDNLRQKKDIFLKGTFILWINMYIKMEEFLQFEHCHQLYQNFHYLYLMVNPFHHQ